MRILLNTIIGTLLFSFGLFTLVNFFFFLVSEVEHLGMSEGLFSAARYCQVPIAKSQGIRCSLPLNPNTYA